MEADHWLNCAPLEDIEEPRGVSIRFEVVKKLMRGCRFFDNAHFTVRVREEIFLGLNGLSFTVPMSTQKTAYDLNLFYIFAPITLV